jgi:putative SOS response-associated peptidase YedK
VTNIRNTSSPHWRGWLKPENRCLVPFNSFAEYEMRFAHLKRILKLGRLRLRGPRGAQDEFVLAAIAQNLRRLASLVARPPPAQALCVV